MSVCACVIELLYFNARSLLPKLDELRVACALECYDLIIVVETWLSARILNYELNIPGYCLLRRDRNRHGGGVLVYVSSSLPFNTLHHNQDLELHVREMLLATGAYTLQESNNWVSDINTRSMTVAEERVTLVGLDTTWDRWKSLKMLFSGERLTFASILKSPQMTKFARFAGRRLDKMVCSLTIH